MSFPSDAFDRKTYVIAGPSFETCQTIAIDAMDQKLLDLLRSVMAANEDRREARAMRDVTAAQRLAPHGTASDVLVQAEKLVFFLGTARSTPFGYMRPADVHAGRFLLPEERSLLQLLHFLRLGKEVEARTQLILLCEGGMDDQVIAAAKGLMTRVLAAQAVDSAA